MRKWIRVEGLQFKLTKTALEVYANSDYEVYRNLHGSYRVTIRDNVNDYLFEVTESNFKEINDFFETEAVFLNEI